MLHAWRWFGPKDSVSLADIRQAGATGIVSALHHVPIGTPWTSEQVRERREQIEAGGLVWSVVESIPVHEDIKRGAPDAARFIAAFVQSMRAVADNGIKTVCYNFMPVVDWTRTDLLHPTKTGAAALRFEMAEFAAFDMHVLKRPGASKDYSPAVLKRALQIAENLSPADAKRIERTIIAGLPGSELHHDLASFRALLASYAGISPDDMRGNLRRFLQAVVPEAHSLGIRLCIHPDDPPFPLFGLPRVVSNLDDLKWVLASVDAVENGITFCAGSLGSVAGNDVLALFPQVAERVHFLHLRNVTVDEDGSFEEAAHLDGRVDMAQLIRLVRTEERRRKAAGRSDWAIPMRPDHGHLFDADRGRTTNPGYSYIGRLRGLAELRGVERAVDAFCPA